MKNPTSAPVETFTLSCGCVTDGSDVPVSMCETMIRLDERYQMRDLITDGMERFTVAQRCREHLTGRWRQVRVGFDVGPKEDGTYTPSFAAWSNGDSWNGWEVPLFEAEAVREFVAWSLAEQSSGTFPIVFDEAKGIVTIDESQSEDGLTPEQLREEGYIYEIEAQHIPVTDVPVWSIGGGSWTWEVFDEQDPEYGTIAYAARYFRKMAEYPRMHGAARYAVIADQFDALVAAGRGAERPTEAVNTPPPFEPIRAPVDSYVRPPEATY